MIEVQAESRPEVLLVNWWFNGIAAERTSFQVNTLHIGSKHRSTCLCGKRASTSCKWLRFQFLNQEQLSRTGSSILLPVDLMWIPQCSRDSPIRKMTCKSSKTKLAWLLSSNKGVLAFCWLSHQSWNMKLCNFSISSHLVRLACGSNWTGYLRHYRGWVDETN